MASKQMLEPCCVCLDGGGWTENPLVYCDGCNAAVHKNCYGITKVPAGNWYCEKCSSKETGDHVRCCLCPKRNGILKKTDDNRWAHVLCALYIPEIRFGDVTTMQPIIVSGIPNSAFNSTTCYVCEENQEVEKQHGVCLNCFKPNCKTVFHVSCGQLRGLLGEEEGSQPGRVQYCGYCAIHSKKSGAKFTRNSSNSSMNGPADVSEDKRDLTTPLSVVTMTAPPEKPKARSRAKPQTTGAAKSKRARKPPAKKSAAATALAKLSPQLKSPLRSPVMRSPIMKSPVALPSPSASKSPINLAPPSTQELLELQFELSKTMLQKQTPIDISHLLHAISMIQHQNLQLEAEVTKLTLRRDNLVRVAARLSQPLPNGTAVPSAVPSTGAASTGTASTAPPPSSTQPLPSFPTILANGPSRHPHQLQRPAATQLAPATTHRAPASTHRAPASTHRAPASTHRAPASMQQPPAATHTVPNIQQPPVNSQQPPVNSHQEPAVSVVSASSVSVKESATKKLGASSANGKEAVQGKKRPSESVIKTNAKQAKQMVPPSAFKSAASRPPSRQQKSSDSGTHFPWPSPSTSSVMQPNPAYSEPTYSDPAYSSPAYLSPAYSNPTQSIAERLPPINALSQSRSAPQISAVSSAYPYNAASVSSLASYSNNAAAVPPLANYSNNSAAVAALAGYASYPQFPMFQMGAATLTDMAPLNPSALTGLAMQGLHTSQQYYMKGTDTSATQKSRAGPGVQ